MSDSNVRIQDDLYQAVNGEWLATAEIPSDRPTIGGFALLDMAVEKTLMTDFAAMAEGSKEIPDILAMKDAVALYKKVLNKEKRDADGIKPVLPTLDKINDMKSSADLNANAEEMLLSEIPLPINISVYADMKDATKYAFYIQGPSIILPDTSYYAEGHENGKKLLAAYENMARKLLAFTNLSEQEQDIVAKDVIAFDKLVAAKVKSQVEWADYVNNYNPMNIDEVSEMVAPFDLKALLTKVYGDAAPQTIIVEDPKAIKEIAGYFCEETFEMYKHWAYVKTLVKSANCLSTEITGIGREYFRTLLGIKQDPVLEKQAYQMTSRIYSEPIGIYYGRTYFGEEAKKDVVDLVKSIIETYKIRMNKNTFLKESTREAAIKKLSTIEIKMGYPDEVHDFYGKMNLTEDESYYGAMQKVGKVLKARELNRLNKAVDRTEWYMPGHMVNACYDPSNNDITFPAAILQKPFYALSQSRSENLGGIGAVIGHEISHAFDNNGAHFDENGNLHDWWTEEDFAAFKALTVGMTEQFDGIPFHGGKVNGELVVSENIADNGGLGVTLEIMHTMADADFQGYFKNWARVWCLKAHEEYIQMLLASDVHSPAELRANMAPRNFDEWYEAFGVTENDKMYIAPDKRISIW